MIGTAMRTMCEAAIVRREIGVVLLECAVPVDPICSTLNVFI